MDSVNQAFLKTIEQMAETTGGSPPQISLKTRDFILDRARPLFGRSLSALNKEQETPSIKFITNSVCTQAANELIKGRLTEAQFITLTKYEKLYYLKTEFCSNFDGEPVVVLRQQTDVTPPITIWGSGRWGWPSIINRGVSLFDLEVNGAGVERRNLTPYALRIDAMNKEYDAMNNKSGCFIATACYGDYNAPEVMLLREFRDKRLLSSKTGSAMVSVYYAISPGIARSLKRHPWAAQFIKNRVLNPIVGMIHSRQTKYTDHMQLPIE